MDKVDNNEQENVISKAPWRQVLRLSKPDWWLLLTGLMGIGLFGVLLSAVYVFFSEAVKVKPSPFLSLSPSFMFLLFFFLHSCDTHYTSNIT